MIFFWRGLASPNGSSRPKNSASLYSGRVSGGGGVESGKLVLGATEEGAVLGQWPPPPPHLSDGDS